MASEISDFKPLLEQSVGYGVVIGVGFFFAFVMLLLTHLQATFTDMSPRSSEEFIAASRNVKPGLVCCGIVSAWTWSATLLQSSTAAYTFGISGPWWYGVGGTIQLAIFGMVAAKVKMNANGAHTFLEIVKVRFGTGPHLLFTFYAFLCIMVVCGSLLLGGAATVNALTGMNTSVYVIVGCVSYIIPYILYSHNCTRGLRATFVCDWSHTLIFGTAPATGGLSGIGIESPVLGNKDGSYLTMKSNQGLVFGAATILSGFSGIFCDQGYWQRAIASHPTSTTKAYMLGGLSWFAVPFAFASCLGLAARALLHDPRFPTFPNPLSPSQISAGLAAPAAAAVVMGKGGAVAVLLVVFIYKTYFRPKANGREIVKVSHCFICFWAVWMGCWAAILHKAQIDLGWLMNNRGVVLSPAVIPIGLTVTWRKLTAPAVFSGAIIGAVLGMVAWMVGCLKIYGEINIPNLAAPYSAVCSGLTGLLFSGLITVGVSLIRPANYDFQGTRAIANLDDISSYNENIDQAKQEKQTESVSKSANCYPADMPLLKAAFRRALWYSSTLTFIVAFLIPIPMFFSHYVFSKSFYMFWVSTSIIWALLSGTFSVVLPVWESRKEIGTILKGCLGLLRGHAAGRKV
ncbi:hypothetical protein BDQ17DRAFT_1461621 [Cyathus striatus]|nr:hypothetical protein BDQ17DRAFT_1461621 [Cyathus striatus]